ncbi:MAG: c-type cytochrome [Pirellulaceae bacterium]|nr:c-type cytochrome [Pirellulaceae bacterium]
MFRACRIPFVWFLVLGSWSFAAEPQSPLAPADAQKLFQLADSSLRIELAAAEPEVIDPVAIRFDEDGRMWVAEMRDYPLGVRGGPISRIRVLEDIDGDGRFEHATTFAERLEFVTGLQPWKGGVFVTLAGSVAYMKDTDGDGKADLDETWFDGFAEQNSQLRANHPRLALDNWIYVANGLRGGKVVSRKLPDQPAIDISGMDFRFDPLTGKAEAVSGNGQFGLCFDDWGNRFTCTNRNPCRHVVIEDRYLRASPGVTVPSVMQDVAAFAENSRIYPISRAWTTSNLHAGQFTAACGVYIYRGDLLPAEFRGNVFTCDPTGNLIHREIMQPAGPTFSSKPAYEGKEFLASPDEWFRPVNMELGPDGALYIVDMYRCVIEHPDFVPTELKNRPDQRLGDDRGRIWRIVPANAGAATADTSPKRQRGNLLLTAASDDLVPLLEHPNAWQRETAQRLLLQREWRPVGKELAKIATESQLPQSRAHAISLLIALGQFDAKSLRDSLGSPDPNVRRVTIWLCESMGHAPPSAIEFRLHLFDSDSAVRFYARATNNVFYPREYRDAHAFSQSAIADANDPWQRQAVKLALGPKECGLYFTALIAPKSAQLPNSEGMRQLVSDLCEQAATSEDAAARQFSLAGRWLLARNPELGLAALAGAMRGFARSRVTLAAVALPNDMNGLRSRLEDVANKSSDALLRGQAISLLGFVPDSVSILQPFVAPDQDQSLRIAAIGALARQPGAEPWPALLAAFPSDTPAVRRAIIDGILANTDRTKLLLDAIDAGKIKANELDPLQAKRLRESRDAALRERAEKLFAAATPAERAKALEDYQPVLAVAGDAKRGRAIFEKNCATCHKIGDLGVNVAPDISDSRTKTAGQLLESILLPNKAIDNNYIGYSVRLVDGTVATGILAAETATSITLRQPMGKELVVARSEIEELRSSGQSLMPEGLERQIPPAEMADLLSFIKNWRYLDGKTPLDGAP